ncbi:STAS domain-containing protein [Rhodococcus qingshengii]|uniref:STAS domain-containing protein n=1 Tax=Rhodococcus TaxID=1827 RepID=UPI001BAF0533|nr:STAS domain-containing protein [Rhodococcus qingshengii]MBS3694117.1 STAS domain-containing protein [Rhodococcus qingshengii]
MPSYATRSLDSGVVVISPQGRLNMVSAPGLRAHLHELVESGSARIVVDLSGIEFIDSSGLGVLISGLKIARQAGGDLRIAAPSLQVETVLELTNLNRVLRAYSSSNEAFEDER